MSHDDNNHQTFLHAATTGQNEGTHRTPSVQVHGGGVVRIQHLGAAGRQEAMQAPAFESTRVHSGSIRLSMAPGGTVNEVGATRHVHTDSGQTGGSVASTFRSSANGGSVETRPGDPTSRTLVAAAMREGLVTRNSAGQLVDRSAVTDGTRTPAEQSKAASDALAAANQPQQSIDDAAPIEHVLGSSMASDLLADLTDHGVDQGSFDRAQARAVDLAVTGSTDRTAMAAALAQEAGMPLELAQQFAEHGIAAYQAAADGIMAKMGIEGQDLQEAYAYMRTKPGALRHVVQCFAIGNDPRPFKKLGMEFIAQRLGRGAN